MLRILVLNLFVIPFTSKEDIENEKENCSNHEIP
jgi:hypothetical protein